MKPRFFPLALSALCVASWLLRSLILDTYGHPLGAPFVTFWTRFFNPSDVWHKDQSDFSQMVASLQFWLRAAIPSYGLSALAFLGLMRRAPQGRLSTASAHRAFPYLAALAFLILATVRCTMFPPPAYATDERAYHFQADLILQGHLRAPAPLHAEAFQSAGVYCKDFWTSSYQPGWPATLALGKALHLEALANCGWWLIGFIMVRRLGASLWGPAEGLWGALLFGISPCFWFSAWGDFTHLQTAALCLVSWDVFRRYLLQPRSWHIPVVLLAWGWIAATRVQDYPVALLVPTVWSLLRENRARRNAGLGVLLLGGLSSIALVCVLDVLQTGSPLKLPFALYARQTFGPWVPEYSLWKALFNLIFYLLRAGWWLPPYFLALLLLRRPRGWDWGLLVGIVSQILFYMGFFSNAGGEWGARFYTISLTSGCLLAGAGCARLQLSRGCYWALALLTLACNLQTFDLAYRYYSVSAKSGQTLESELQREPTLVFIRQLPQGSEADAAIFNRPDFAPPVRAIWTDPLRNEEVRKMFPQLRCLVLDAADPQSPQLSAYQQPDWQAFYRAGVGYISSDRERAIACLEKALPTADPAKTYRLIGSLQRDIGRFGEAYESLSRALEYSPDNVDLQRERYEVQKKLPGKNS